MSHPAKNVDDILFSQPSTPASEIAINDSPENLPIAPTLQETSDLDQKHPAQDFLNKETLNNSETDSLVDTADINNVSDSHDEFGTPIEPKKERVYTEAEVNQMMRERLARVKQERDTPPIQQQQEINQDADSDGWETQLEQFIDNTLTKREQQIQQRNWQQQEQQRQAEFEIKFNNSAARYNDFEAVVSGKPLTAEMVIATRSMSDPAAFIYAAAKTQSVELARISQITDPVQLGVELGRLEERMKRSRGTVSNAPRPNTPLTGDSSHKVKRELSIDEKIAADAKRMRR